MFFTKRNRLGSRLETPGCKKTQKKRRRKKKGFSGVAGKEKFFVKGNTLGSKLEIPKSRNMISLVGAMASLVN